MAGPRDDRAEQLFLAALDLPPSERDAFLEGRCADDLALLREVRSLLPFADVSGQDDGFLRSPLRRPPAGPAARDTSPDAVPREREALPERIGRYTIVRTVSEGGMGIVYEARQTRPDRTVALKAIRPGLAGPGVERRFELEAEVLGRLQHPGIAHIYEAGVAETTDARGNRYRQPFFAMEYVAGQPLDRYCAASGGGIHRRLQLFAVICDAVQHAHDHGVVHRDLKPANILVDAEGRPKILDFGVARVLGEGFSGLTMGTATGQVLGTLPYMSPEQVAGNTRGLDARSDVYSLGVLLYEVLAGRLPHEVRGRTLAEAARTILEEEPTRLGSVDTALRGDVDTIVSRALEKEPERRYASARELGEDIRRHLQSRPITAHPPSAFYQLRTFARRNRALVGGVLTTLLALLLGTAVATTLALREAHKSDQLESLLYRRELSGASAALEAGDRPLARDLLASGDVPASLRGWEWGYLRSRAEEAGIQIPSPGRPSSVRPFFEIAGDDLELFTDGRGYRFDTATGEQLASWPLPRDAREPPHGRLRDAPDARHYAVITGEGDEAQVRLYDQDHRLCGTTPGESVGFGPAGSDLMVVPERSLNSVVWKLTACEPAFALPITFPVFTSDGSSLVGFQVNTPDGSDGDYAIRAYDMPSGRMRSRFPVESAPRAVAIGPRDRLLLAGGYDGAARVYEISSGRLLQEFEAHHGRAVAVAFAPDGARIATAGSDGWVRIWDLESTHQVEGYRLGSLVQQLQFLPGARLLALRRDGNVTILDPAARAVPWVLCGHESYVYAVAYHPSGEWFASADFGGRIQLWDARSGLRIGELRGPQQNIYALRFSPDGSRLIATSRSRIEGRSQAQVAVWDVEPRILLATHTLLLGGSLIGIGHPMDRSGMRIALGWEPEERSITIWDVARDQVSTQPVSGHLPPSRRWVSADGRFAAEDRPDTGVLEVHDLTTGSMRRLPAAGAYLAFAFSHGRQGPVRVAAPLQASPDAEDGGETLGVWDARSGHLLGELRGHTREVLVVEFSPDDRRIATGSRDGTIRIWDSATLKELLRLQGHRFYIKDLVFSPDGSQLVSASGDRTLRIWDTIPASERVAAAPGPRRSERPSVAG